VSDVSQGLRSDAVSRCSSIGRCEVSNSLSEAVVLTCRSRQESRPPCHSGAGPIFAAVMASMALSLPLVYEDRTSRRI
jgi:hypothetical protein